MSISFARGEVPKVAALISTAHLGKLVCAILKPTLSLRYRRGRRRSTRERMLAAILLSLVMRLHADNTPVDLLP